MPDLSQQFVNAAQRPKAVEESSPAKLQR